MYLQLLLFYSILRDRTFARMSDEDWGIVTVTDPSNVHALIITQILFSVCMSEDPS